MRASQGAEKAEKGAEYQEKSRPFGLPSSVRIIHLFR